MAVKGVLIESITKTPEVGPPPTRQTLDLQGWITPKLETFCAFNAFLGFLLGSRFGFAFSFLQNCRRTTSETRGSVSRYFISCRWLLLFTDVLSLTIILIFPSLCYTMKLFLGHPIHSPPPPDQNSLYYQECCLPF